MIKTTGILVAAAVTASLMPAQDRLPVLQLKEERLTVEYTHTLNEAALVMAAETEAQLAEVELRGPGGLAVLKLRSASGPGLALSGFVIESRESDTHSLFDTYPEGMYSFRGRTVQGQPIEGRARLKHSLPRAPFIQYPSEGELEVPHQGLTLSWLADPEAVAYRVVLEQNENDGLTVDLHAGVQSLLVPDGVLQANTDTLMEVAAIGRNGNRTVTEIQFRTR